MIFEGWWITALLLSLPFTIISILYTIHYGVKLWRIRNE